MKLIKQVLSSMPIAGWTPDANTIYLVSDKFGKIYVPVPATQKLAYLHTRPSKHQGVLYQELMLSDYIHIGGSSSGNRPVKIEFLTSTSPYAVRFTTPSGIYVASMYDSLDTSLDITTNLTIDPVSVCHAQGQAIRNLSPSYLWTFNEQYDTTVDSHYIDEVAFSRLKVTSGFGVYPSPMDDIAYRAWHCTPGGSGSAEVHHPTSLSYYSLILWASASADCVLLKTDKLTIHIVGGKLEVKINAFTHTTSLNVLGIVHSPSPVVFPMHKIILTIENTTLNIVVNNVLVSTVSIPIGVDATLSSITPINIPEETCPRTYVCIAVVPAHVPLEHILCTALTKYIPPSMPVAINSTNCSTYSVRHWKGNAVSATNRLALSGISEQGVICIKILASDDAVATITYATNDVTGKTYFVPLKKDTLRSEQIWVDRDGAIQVTVSPASATITAYSIGEH